jgi:hypothetical protein
VNKLVDDLEARAQQLRLMFGAAPHPEILSQLELQTLHDRRVETYGELLELLDLLEPGIGDRLFRGMYPFTATQEAL